MRVVEKVLPKNVKKMDFGGPPATRSSEKCSEGWFFEKICSIMPKPRNHVLEKEFWKKVKLGWSMRVVEKVPKNRKM